MNVYQNGGHPRRVQRCQSSQLDHNEIPVDARHRTATVPHPPFRLLRALAIWRSLTSAQTWTETLMDAFTHPRRKVGVVAMSTAVRGQEDQEAGLPSFLQACEQCDEDVVRYLLRKGISKEALNARDKTGKTGLSHACCNGFVTVVNLLRRPEVDVCLADNEGNNPLIFAAQAGHADIVGILLNYFPGVNLDQPNHQGFTALMKASLQGRARCAKLLLYAGATPYARDSGRGLCALEWAEYCGRHGTARVIAQFMEACNLGLTCTTLVASPGRTLGQHQRHLSSVQQSDPLPSRGTREWRSESSLANSTDNIENPAAGCMPFRILRRMRRSLPTSGIESAASFSPLESLEDIARLCYSPLFPEYISPPSSRKCSPYYSKRQQLTIPKVEITLTSKDDNYYYETSMPFVRSPSAYRRYLENTDGSHHSNKKDKGV